MSRAYSQRANNEPWWPGPGSSIAQQTTVKITFHLSPVSTARSPAADQTQRRTETRTYNLADLPLKIEPPETLQSGSTAIPIRHRPRSGGRIDTRPT